MNKELLFTLIATGAILLIASNEKKEVQTNIFDDMNDEINNVKKGLKTVLQTHGEKFAKDVERLMRWETNHFRSMQWNKGNTAGMESFKPLFPYGWSSLSEFAADNNLPSNYFSTYQMKENGTGKIKTFIKFPDAYWFTIYVAWFITNKRSGRFGKWYSLNEDSAKRYEEKISKVKPRFVDEILKSA